MPIRPAWIDGIISIWPHSPSLDRLVTMEQARRAALRYMGYSLSARSRSKVASFVIQLTYHRPYYRLIISNLR